MKKITSLFIMSLIVAFTNGDSRRDCIGKPPKEDQNGVKQYDWGDNNCKGCHPRDNTCLNECCYIKKEECNYLDEYVADCS